MPKRYGRVTERQITVGVAADQNARLSSQIEFAQGEGTHGFSPGHLQAEANPVAGQIANADGVGWVDEGGRIGLDALAIDHCAVSAAQIGDGVATRGEVQAEVVARYGGMVDDDIIAWGAAYGDPRL